MKILFISDIHGVIDNLNTIYNVIKKEKIDKFIVLGDLYSYSFNKNYKNDLIVEKFLEKYKDILICMRGNSDSLTDIKKSSFPIIEDISMITVDDIDIYITHGNRYNFYNNSIFSNGVMIYGHEHIPYIKKEDDMVYINIGSISLPRDNNKPTYTIYENREFTIYSIENNIIDKIEV